MKALKRIAATSAVFLLHLTPGLALAAGAHDDKHHPGNPEVAKSTGESASTTDAEVRKVDKEARKITLKHGEIKNLGMPAMSMVFQVRDSALLENVKAGDKVKFRAEKISGGYAVTDIEVAK